MLNMNYVYFVISKFITYVILLADESGYGMGDSTSKDASLGESGASTKDGERKPLQLYKGEDKETSRDQGIGSDFDKYGEGKPIYTSENSEPKYSKDESSGATKGLAAGGAAAGVGAGAAGAGAMAAGKGIVNSLF